MDIDKDRRLGIDMAKAIGATKTLAAIESKDACFAEILKIGVAELGLDVVVSQILQGPPEWAYRAYLNIPDLGSHSDALLQRGAEAPAGTRGPDPDSARPEVATIAANNSMLAAPTSAQAISAMNLSCQGIFVCNWTLEWTDSGEPQPTEHYKDWNSWLWTDNLTQYKSSGKINFKKFADAVPESQLNKGDAVWMYVYVQAGYDANGQGQFSFVYDPGSSLCANFVISGTTSNTILSLQSVS